MNREPEKEMDVNGGKAFAQISCICSPYKNKGGVHFKDKV